MSDDLLSRLGQVAREQDDEARALEATEDPTSELLRARVLAQAQEQLRPAVQPAARRWTRPLIAGGLLAAAALVLVWLRPSHDALPPYALSVTGSLEEMRGPSETQVLRFGPSSQIEIVMRPAEDVHAALQLRLWLEQKGVARRLPAAAERSDTGTLRVVTSGRELLSGAPGRSHLTVFVCLPEQCAAREEALRKAQALPTGQVKQLELEYLP